MQKTINKQELISTRAATPKDHNFIMATFLRGLYYGDTWFNLVPKNIFMAHYHAILERLLKSQVTIKVACLRDDPEVILGYSVSRKIAVQDQSVTIIDWIFVKSAWRKIGIAKTLMPENAQACSHMTKLGLSIMRQKAPNMVFNPFLT